jgi:hypothetical protein
MLSKLLGYDLRTQAKSAVPMFVSSAIISVVCCALLYFSMSFTEAENFFVGATFAMGLFAMGILAIAVICVGSIFVSIGRYYKSLFTDEGYLTMVIPVKTSTLLCAKVLASFINCTASLLVFFASIFIAVIMPVILFDPSYFAQIFDVAGFLFNTIGIPENALGFTLQVIYAVANLVCSVNILLTAITVGSTVMTKHKIFGSIIFFYVIAFIEGLIESVASIVLVAISQDVIMAVINTVIRIFIVLSFGALMYAVNLYVLKNKFNIE